MVFQEGFEYYNLETNNTYRIYRVGENGYFAIVHCLSKDGTEWIPVMEPVDLERLKVLMKLRRIIPNTVAGRMLYGKKL